MSIAVSKNGHAIIEFSKGWVEDLPKEQNPHIIWGEIGYKKITATQAAKLLAGEEIEMKGLKGKAGKPFDAFVSYNFDTRKIEYKFVEKPKKYIEADEKTAPSSLQNKNELPPEPDIDEDDIYA